MDKTLKELNQMLIDAGIHDRFITAYSPGDGVTRYRMVRRQNDYFAGDPVFTVLGRKAAYEAVDHFLSGVRYGLLASPK